GWSHAARSGRTQRARRNHRLPRSTPERVVMSAFVKASLVLSLFLFAIGAQAQRANDVATQNAILAALPKGVSAESATVDQIAQAAIDVAFGMEGNLEANVTQVTIALGEMTRAGKFQAAPRF